MTEIKALIEDKAKDVNFSCSKCGTLLIRGDILHKSNVSCPKCGKHNIFYKFRNMREEVNKLRGDIDYWMIAYFLNVAQPTMKNWIAKNKWERHHMIVSAINKIKSMKVNEQANNDIKEMVRSIERHRWENNRMTPKLGYDGWAGIYFELTVKNMHIILDWELPEECRQFMRDRLERVMRGEQLKRPPNSHSSLCYFMPDDEHRIPIYDFEKEIGLPLQPPVPRLTRSCLTRSYVIPD